MTRPAKKAMQNKKNRFYLEDLDHKKILLKFLSLNNARLKRTKDSLTKRQLELLHLLPLLFHINHPSLPGFVSSQCPKGIVQYNPDKESVRYARKISKSFEYKRRAYRQYDIQALYFMGSTGTIAYSDKSDFDVWVCHREDLSATDLETLKLKTERITQWCLDINLEINFFLLNTQRFRKGEIEQLSSESSGSTQHLLLLEEFYRTSILLAGCYPIWWMVPPEFENEYDDYVENINHQRLLNDNEFLNFGPVSHILAEEFYGATLWHIYKGIDSPFKSILKLLLMECYAKEHPEIDLLCLQYKRAVYQEDNPDINNLDPYIMMMDKITTHLLEEKSLTRLKLARQCLYLKVNESLTELKNSTSHEWRQQIMHNLVTHWKWKHPQLLLLDRRNQWKIAEVIDEHKKIIEALTYSYRKLSDFFRYQNKSARISKRDVHILGRKLYAAFEKKAGKIEVIHHTHDLHEQHISLHPIYHEQELHEQSPHSANPEQQKEQGWALYIGAFNQINQQTPAPIKKSTHLLKLLCWGYFNQIISSHTGFIINKENTTLSLREIKQILEALEQTFPGAKPGYASMSALIKSAQLDLNIMFLNIALDPFLANHPDGSQIASNQTNALNYGSMHENLLMTIDQVFLTSWHEVMTQHFDGEHGLMECLCQYLKWNYATETTQNFATAKHPTLVCCFSSVRGDSISRCIQRLFINVLDAFHGPQKAFTTRYLLTIEESYYLLWQEENGPRYQKIPDRKELIRELSYPLSRFNSLVIDPDFSDFTVLQLIFASNKENYIQLFYHNHKKTADIYIIDERGSLYHHSTNIEQHNIHINHFMIFLDSVVNRLSFSNNYFDDSQGSLNDPNSLIALNDLNYEEADIDLQLEVYEIQTRNYQLTLDKQVSKLQNMPAAFFKIQVIADLNNDGSRHYIIYANEKEFNSFEYGNNLYKKVAEEVVNTRRNRQRYPIYITDIDLSAELRDSESDHGIQVTQLLKFKQEIERRLNQAILNL